MTKRCRRETSARAYERPGHLRNLAERTFDRQHCMPRLIHVAVPAGSSCTVAVSRDTIAETEYRTNSASICATCAARGRLLVCLPAGSACQTTHGRRQRERTRGVRRCNRGPAVGAHDSRACRAARPRSARECHSQPSPELDGAAPRAPPSFFRSRDAMLRRRAAADRHAAAAHGRPAHLVGAVGRVFAAAILGRHTGAVVFRRHLRGRDGRAAIKPNTHTHIHKQWKMHVKCRAARRRCFA